MSDRSATMSERTLLLLRHAKSSWDDAGLADRDRPLAPRGRRDACALGHQLRRRDYEIDRVLCSPARRTRETLARLALPDETPTRFAQPLYLGSARTLLAQLRRLPDEVHCALLIAHDPGIEQLANQLAGGGRAKARARLARGFVTGALAELRFERSWRALAPGSAFLQRFTRPKDL
jgi:phosphohistidine phosphatase